MLIPPAREVYYDKAKRYAEALTTAYRTSCGADTGIVRIFNTYGPRMRPDDGRVVSSFIDQALRCEPLTVFGDGSQTRSLCYVDDLVRGIAAMLDSREPGPINLGNPVELTIRQIAELVRELVGSPRRSSCTRYRKMIRHAESPTSPGLAIGWVGAHRCQCAKDLLERSSGMRRPGKKSARHDHVRPSKGVSLDFHC